MKNYKKITKNSINNMLSHTVDDVRKKFPPKPPSPRNGSGEGLGLG